MRKHRNPRPRLAKRATTGNRSTKPSKRPRRRLDPRASAALRVLLDALASTDQRVAMRFVEALSAFVAFAAQRRAGRKP